jgi:hypothetical protein
MSDCVLGWLLGTPSFTHVGIMNQAILDAVGNGRIADLLVPSCDRHLRSPHQVARAVQNIERRRLKVCRFFALSDAFECLGADLLRPDP